MTKKKQKSTNKEDFILLSDCNRQTTLCYRLVTNKQMKETNKQKTKQKTKKQQQKQTNMTSFFSQTDAIFCISNHFQYSGRIGLVKVSGQKVGAETVRISRVSQFLYRSCLTF